MAYVCKILHGCVIRTIQWSRNQSRDSSNGFVFPFDRCDGVRLFFALSMRPDPDGCLSRAVMSCLLTKEQWADAKQRKYSIRLRCDDGGECEYEASPSNDKSRKNHQDALGVINNMLGTSDGKSLS